MQNRHVLVTDIQWDVDDGDPVKDHGLPEKILYLDVVEDLDYDPSLDPNSEFVSDTLSSRISDDYGYCHRGFRCKWFDPSECVRLGRYTGPVEVW